MRNFRRAELPLEGQARLDGSCRGREDNGMLEVDAAREIVLAQGKPRNPVVSGVSAELLGRVLAEDVRADRDSPPFAKAMMDGYAVRSGDCAGGSAELRIVEEIPAGAVPTRVIAVGECARIFTGAPIPEGSDAVVMQERTVPLGDRVRVTDSGVSPGRNVMPRGKEMTAGDVVLRAGSVLTPVAFGVLGSVGKVEIAVVPAPRVGILATGDELVEADVEPGPGQIRNSNGPMLAALVARAGGVPKYLGIVRDDVSELRERIGVALQESDVLLLTGGVSVGKLDLVPGVLADLGVTAHFHKVRMKPGKPLLFGTQEDKLVFGLPGNPVSALVGFELFVRPALRKLAGHANPGPTEVSLPLAESVSANHDRPTYAPGKLEGGRVQPLPWSGSGDLRAMLDADAWIVLPPGEVRLQAGETISVLVM